MVRFVTRKAIQQRPTFKAGAARAKNPSRDARALVELLWLEDSIALLERHGLDRGVRSKPRRIIWDRICESLDIEVIAAAVRAHLKTRAISTDHP